MLVFDPTKSFCTVFRHIPRASILEKSALVATRGGDAMIRETTDGTT